MESVDPGVLEEAPDDRDDADVLAYAGHPCPQAADAADVQVDPDAGLRGLVERADALAVDQRVHLHHDPRLLAGAVRVHRALDLAEYPRAHVIRRDNRPLVGRRARRAG